MQELTFEDWMRQVDREIGRQSGMGLKSNDLPDWHYRDQFNDEYSPEEAAREVLEENNFPFEGEGSEG